MVKKVQIEQREEDFIPIKKMRELSIGTEVWIRYHYWPYLPFRPHTIRKRIILKEHNIPYWNSHTGKAFDETEESYQEYKEWLRDRVERGEIFRKKEGSSG